MKIRNIALIVITLFVSSCAMTTSRAKKELDPGMSREQVRKIVGNPDDRSFQGSNEAWQYYDVAGFGQCEYLTAWFSSGVLTAITTRRGSSVAGCGLGSTAVDWGQMPKPSLDVNLNIQNKSQ